MDPLEPLLTTEDVANFLKVDVVTVRRLVNRSEIGAYRIGNEFRFSIGDVRTFLERQYSPARADLDLLNIIDGPLVVSEDEQGLLKRFRLFRGTRRTAIAPAQVDLPTAMQAERGFLEQLTGKRRRKSEPLSKLTKRARSGLIASVQEAHMLDKPYIGTDHVLLGLLSIKDSSAATALDRLGVSYGTAREAAASMSASETVATQPRPNELPMTATTQRMIEHAFKEANRLGHDYVGTEHLLLGLLGQENSVGYGVLVFLKVDLERLRDELVRPGPSDE